MQLADADLEKLLDDGDHACEMEHPRDVPCGKPAAHLLRGGPCTCELPCEVWVCDGHLSMAIGMLWECNACDELYYWREI